VALDELHREHRWVDTVQAMELVCNFYRVDYPRAERYSSKIKDYDHAAHRLAPNQAPVLDLHETDHPNPQLHDPQFRPTGRTHHGMSGRCCEESLLPTS
jgi:hypothetical protein